MSRYLVGLQTIQTGATKKGDEVIKYQMGSHLIRRGSQDEQEEVRQKMRMRLDSEGQQQNGEEFGGQTMSLMVAGVMETSMPLSSFLDSLWMQHALVASRSEKIAGADEVFNGAFEIATPKPDAAALNLLLYFRKDSRTHMERVASAVETRILPGLQELSQDGIAFAGQFLPQDRVRRRVTSDREYLYGNPEHWGAYALKIRFPRSNEYSGYVNGGTCLGVHLDDISHIPFERIVKLLIESRMIGAHAAERIEVQDAIFDHREKLSDYLKTLTKPEDRMLADLVADVLDVLHIGTIYDRKLARARDFWKKVKGV